MRAVTGMLMVGIGPLFDKYGSKRLLPVGALGLVVSLVATSLCSGKL
jgi:hypothetical protein